MADDNAWNSTNSWKDAAWKSDGRSQKQNQGTKDGDAGQGSKSHASHSWQSALDGSTPAQPVATLYRCMRADLTDLEFKSTPELHLDRQGGQWKSLVFHMMTNGHKRGIRSPFLHMSKSFAAAQKRYNAANRNKCFQEAPGYIVSLDFGRLLDGRHVIQEDAIDLSTLELQKEWYAGHDTHWMCEGALRTARNYEEVLLCWRGNAVWFENMLLLNEEDGSVKGHLINFISKQADDTYQWTTGSWGPIPASIRPRPSRPRTNFKTKDGDSSAGATNSVPAIPVPPTQVPPSATNAVMAIENSPVASAPPYEALALAGQPLIAPVHAPSAHGSQPSQTHDSMNLTRPPMTIFGDPAHQRLWEELLSSWANQGIIVANGTVDGLQAVLTANSVMPDQEIVNHDPASE